jgi:hypothetical protein
VPLAGGDPLAQLGRVEAHGQVRLDRRPLDLAAGGVDPGGDVAGDHRRPAAIDRLDRAGGRLPRRSREAGAEDRVHDGAGTGQPAVEIAGNVPGPEVDRLHLEPHATEMTGRDLAVAAVVPLAANDPQRPLRSQSGDRLGQRRPRRLHQLGRGDPLRLDRPGIDGTDAIGVI